MFRVLLPLLTLLPTLAIASNLTLIDVPAGTYSIGSTDGRSSAQPLHEIALDAFRIDQTEVTNAAFVRFLNTLDVTAVQDAPPGNVPLSALTGAAADLLVEGNGAAPRPYIALNDEHARIGVSGGEFIVETGYEHHPVTETTWDGALAYCRWRGGRLPSEVEWEAAARGLEGRRYPWGDTPPTPNRAVYGRGSGRTAPVGTHLPGATPEGIQDLAGNVAEWTSSLYRPYPYNAMDGREDLTVNAERVTRGGDHVFDSDPSELTGYFREGFSREPTRGHRHIGFRCVVDDD